MKIKFFLLVSLFLVSIVSAQKKWTLKECVDHALKNNLTVKQNFLNVEQAKLNVKTNKGNFLPDLSASTNSNLSAGSNFDPVTNNRTSSSTFFGGGIGLSSGITVFNGFRNLNSYKQAKLGVERSMLELEKIQNDISLSIVNNYLNVLFAKENLSVANVQAEISKKQVDAAKERFNAGVIPKGDLLNVQSTAATDQQNVVNQENTLSIALLSLAQLLQVSAEDFDIESINFDIPTEVLVMYKNANMVYQKALNSQPQIKNAELAIDDADYNIEIAKGGFLPVLSASIFANTNFNYVLKPSGFPNGGFFDQLDGNLGYGVGFRLNVPIFNRTQTRTNVNQQFVNKEISKVLLENEKLQLQQTIEQAYVDTKAALKAYEAASISLEAQQEAFKNARQSYDLGAMTLFDFDLVRNRLVSAESTLIRAKYDYVFKTKVLQFYYGDLTFD